MPDNNEITEISCHDVSGLIETKWRCHIYTRGGKHYEGEGFTEEKAKKNAMAVYNANKNKN